MERLAVKGMPKILTTGKLNSFPPFYTKTDQDREKLAACGAHGFSLIELVVVCLLIGLFLSLALPSMRSVLYTNPLKSDARKLIGMVKEVRALAARENRAYLMQVDRDHNTFAFEPKNKTAEEEESDTRKELVLAEGIEVTKVVQADTEASALNDISIWISPKGYMEELRIRLEDQRDDWLELVFQPFVDDVVFADE